MSDLFETTVSAKSGASNNRHRSRQTYGTPWEFIRAIESRFGVIRVDLAADMHNTKAPTFIGEEQNSFKVDWSKFSGNCFLNPEFGFCAAWASKAAAEAEKGTRILMLTPASCDANWWKAHVHGKAWVEFLSPRIQFDGADDPFPKPLALSVYGICGIGYGCWRWK